MSDGRRVHLNIGPECNNNCIFCMEDDRKRRRRVNGALDAARVRQILEQNSGSQEACFTSGEPTLVPDLPRYIRWASRLGYGRVSVMTNGRRLAYPDYCDLLADAGLDHVYISIHGHTAKLHDGLARTPGAFHQTLAGLDNAARLAGRGVGLHSSTVVTTRNLAHLAEIYRFLRARGVQQVVFNVMQAEGRAHRHFERLYPRYPDIAAAYGSFLEQLDEQEPPVFLVDIPRCATAAIPAFNRGSLEQYVHYEVDGGATVEVRRTDHDLWQRDKRAACARCRHDAACPGVWKNYLERYGWVGLEPMA